MKNNSYLLINNMNAQSIIESGPNKESIEYISVPIIFADSLLFTQMFNFLVVLFLPIFQSRRL